MVVENAISQPIADARYLKLAGGTMTGAIAMGGQNITNAASIALAEQSPVPASASTNTIVTYAEAVKGFSFLSTLDDTGMRRKMQRDSVFVAKNTTGSSIPAARAVYAIGSEDDVPLIAKARANSTSTMPAIGVTLEAVADGAYGRVMQIGLVENVDTSAFTAGDVLYVSATTAGILVKTAPLYPNVRQEMGTILAVDASAGSVQVIARSMFNDGIIDHGGLLGLSDNDHTQYLLLSGGTMAGALNMGTNAISNAGAITGAAITGTSFVIGANTLDTNEWANLDGLDQSLKVADNVEFAQVTLTGVGKTIYRAATQYINSGAAGYIDIYADTAVRAAASTFRCWDAVAPNLRVSTGQVDATASSLVLGLATGGNQFVIGTGSGDSVLAAKTGGELFFAIGSTEVYRLVDTTTIRVKSTNQFQFNAATEYIASLDVNYMDYAAATAHRFAGAVTMDSTVTIAGNLDVDSGAVLVDHATRSYFALRESGNDNSVLFYAAYGTDQVLFTMSAAVGRQCIFADSTYFNRDFDHAVQTNPTVYGHDGRDPNVSNNAWWGLTHDATGMLISTGANTGAGTAPATIDNYIMFSPRGTEAGRFEGGGDFLVSTTKKWQFNDSGTYANSPSNGVFALVTDGTITLGAAATNQMVVSSTGLTYFTGTAGLPFAAISVDGNSTETAIAGAGTYVQVTIFDTNENALDAVPDHTNDHITITKAGHYSVTFRACAETVDADPDVFTFSVRKNNGTVTFTTLCSRQKMIGLGGADYRVFGATAILDLAATDTIELWATNESDTSNILVTNAYLSVEMKAGT